MKDIYETPVMEVIYFEAEDIITNSGDSGFEEGEGFDEQRIVSE